MKYFSDIYKKHKVVRIGFALSLVTVMFTSPACGLFASSDGFEVYTGTLPDKAIIKDSAKLPKRKFRAEFTKENYPRPVHFVDGRNLLDKSFNESVLAAQAVLSDKFEIDLQNPLLRNKEQQAWDLLYNTAWNRGYRVFLLPSFSHGQAWDPYYQKNKETIEKEKDFLFVGVDFRFKPGTVKAGHAVSLNFKSEESSFVIGYAAAKYLANKYEDKNERVIASFAGTPFSGTADFVFGFLEGIKYWNQTNTKRVRFLGDNVDTSSGFDASLPAATTSINRALSGGKTKIIFPAAGGAIARRLLSETEKNPDIFVIGVDTDFSKVLPEYKEKIFTSAMKHVGTWYYKVLEDYYSGDYKLLVKGKNMDLYKGLREEWVGYAPSTVKDSSKVNAYLAEGDSIFRRILEGKVTSDWAKDYKVYKNSPAPHKTPEALAAVVQDINSLFEAGN